MLTKENRIRIAKITVAIVLLLAALVLILDRFPELEQSKWIVGLGIIASIIAVIEFLAKRPQTRGKKGGESGQLVVRTSQTLEVGGVQQGTVTQNDQRDQTVQGPQTNVGIAHAPVVSGQIIGSVNISQTTRLGTSQYSKDGKALLTARLEKRENDVVTVEITNIGHAIATNIRISFAGRKEAHSGGQRAPIPNSASIPAGESIPIKINCRGWKDINIYMQWNDDSGLDNENTTYLPLEPI